ncbi:hypothetical protein SAMN05216464_11263 [Mucilaginibacter pineti]|uniref:Uncharacterized protein n=1 Tax=Mucilaginibacter pineti TaxID=1391627 RepID=A0A1G7HXI1_9SPHI|nr:hypothetical protein [Mucilaginibacter pineti]SDF05063.1 hypothetical protein SAMN05216464_11263 [Mucilaginibacter pineti]
MLKCANTFLLLIIALSTGFTTKLDEVTNYYGIPETLTFDNVDFKLSWSSHPNATYYKQEYLPKNNTSEHFDDMLIIDFIVTDLSVKDAVGAQIKTLMERKKTDAICNYSVAKSPDGNEYILDFLMSESAGDKISIIEWNGYHYKPYTDKAGHNGVLLFAISHRAYSDQAIPFLKSLKTYKTEQVTKLLKYPTPEIQLK